MGCGHDSTFSFLHRTAAANPLLRHKVPLNKTKISEGSCPGSRIGFLTNRRDRLLQLIIVSAMSTTYYYRCYDRPLESGFASTISLRDAHHRVHAHFYWHFCFGSRNGSQRKFESYVRKAIVIIANFCSGTVQSIQENNLRSAT